MGLILVYVVWMYKVYAKFFYYFYDKDIVMNIRVRGLFAQFVRRTDQLLRLLLFFVSIAVPILIVYRFGFPISATVKGQIMGAFHVILAIQWVLIALMLVLVGHRVKVRVSRIVGFAIFTVIAVLDFSLHAHFLHSDHFLRLVTHDMVVMVTSAAVSVAQISRYVTSLLSRRTTPSMILAGSFLIIIIIGSLLLKLPNCTVNGISYTDSLFVATSAVCVTGLTPIDISTELTTTGMVVLLFLIQIGGLGIMTITSFFGLFFAGSRSFAGQMVVGDLLATNQLSSLLRTLVRIIAVTLSIEAIGALFLYGSAVDSGHFSGSEALFFGVFHSVSAFCNAGFSTLSGNLADPKIQALSSIQWVVSALIIFGGIGFPIFSNFLSIVAYKMKNFFRWIYGIRPLVRVHLWSLNTYIVVRTTLILLAVGWGGFLALEWNASLAGFSFAEKLSQGFLMAVTPRTAGFSGVSLSTMMPASVLLTIALMWIGGAPQSTAGGIKVTTFYVAIKNIFFAASSRDTLEVHHRTIPSSSVARAFSVIALSLFIIAMTVAMLSILEPHVELSRLVFEVVSAISTVGLSLDLTPHLGDMSKYILILLMFMGRVGLISIFVLFIRRTRHKPYSYPNENILIT